MDSPQIESHSLGQIKNIDRESVRRYVAEYTSALQAASERGENTHQLGLDHQDKVEQFAATLNANDADRFWKLYTEELNAYSSSVNEKTMQTLAQNAQNASNMATWTSLIAFLVFLFVIIKIVKG